MLIPAQLFFGWRGQPLGWVRQIRDVIWSWRCKDKTFQEKQQASRASRHRCPLYRQQARFIMSSVGKSSRGLPHKVHTSSSSMLFTRPSFVPSFLSGVVTPVLAPDTIGDGKRPSLPSCSPDFPGPGDGSVPRYGAGTLPGTKLLGDRDLSG